MAEPHGLLLIDKPRGKTSHDVVAEVRRALSTRHVGHAGTLDPMATGLLVVLVGDATRIAPFLTDADKSYRATISLGVTTDSLDADGKETERVAVSDELRRELSTETPGIRLQNAIETELARTEQIPPQVSAIHVNGARAYERSRRGEVVELAPRSVRLRSLTLLDVDRESTSLTIEITCEKGYYVRSLARDLGASLGVPAHLTALRRLRSGGFDVNESVPLAPRDALPIALRTTSEALTRALPIAELTDEGALRSRQGKVLDDTCFAIGLPQRTTAWFHQGKPIAIGGSDGRVIRGFPSG